MRMIENKTKRTITLTHGSEHKVIIPGVNQLSDAEYKTFKASIEDSIKEKKFEDHSAKAETDIIENLKDFKAEDAITLVEKTVDEDLLACWLKDEKRKGVKDAIAKKLNAVQAAVASGSDKKTDAASNDEEEF